MLGSAGSEHLTLTDSEIIFEEFQPVITIHQRHRQTDRDRQTDRQTDGRHAIAGPRFAL